MLKPTMVWNISTLYVLALALTCGLHVNAVRVRRSNHVSNICSMWGNFHFKTFDGDVYQFQGTCEYNLVSDCHGPVQGFSVHVKRAQTPGNPEITRVMVTIGGISTELTKKLVRVNREVVKLPHYVAGVMLEENSIYIKLYAKLGLSVTWNRDDAVTVEVDSKYFNRTCGLCGDFNGVPVFDKSLSDGRVTGFIEFGNKHRIHNPNDNCEDPYETFESEANPLDKCQPFRDECSELLLGEPWSFCRSVLSPEPYVQACMMDKCMSRPGDTEDTVSLCSTLSEYSRQCSHSGGRPPNWRKSTFCAVTCPFSMEYSESGSPCLDTCTHADTSSLCEEHKMDGCFCPPGTVFDDISERGCILQEQCQCKHDKVYNPGEVLLKNDEECVCQQGKWMCKSLSIPGVCAMEEGLHFTTFDGKEFTFHGNCYYVLSKDCVDSKFILLGQLVPCVANPSDTCLKSVAFILNNDKSNALIIKDDGIVRQNGDLKVPYSSAEFTVFRPSSFHIMLQTSFGLQVQVQLVPLMQLYITLDQSFHAKTCGLCGNFNLVLSDELLTSQGVVEGTATSFANSWKAQSNCPDQIERLDDPCSYSIDSESYAEHWCSKLKEKKGVFAKCHSAINPEKYYKRCKYSSCTCEKSEDCLCAVFSSYVRACAAKGVFLQGWRETVCDKYTKSCPASQTFTYKLQQCQRTCDSLSLDRQGCSTDYLPVDGCACPEGLYEGENGVCVPMDKCPCYYNGEHIKPGKSINIKNEHCICANGKLQCHSLTPHVKACRAPKVFFNCSTAEPDEHGLECAQTCAQKDVDCYLADCESGCQCPTGLLDDGRGSCVKEHDCPCKHNNEFYAPGSQIPEECNTCICKHGKWHCTQKQCPGTCTIYGSGHYKTFDKQRFGFSGDCSYIALQDKCGNKTGTFHVITENVPCGTTGTTCSKAVRIVLGRTELELSDGKITEIEAATSLSINFNVRNVGLYLVIESDIGLTVLWDRKTTVRIILQPQHMGEVCGLCGNYNGNGKDDFITQGLLHVSDVLEFVNSWKVQSHCPDAKPDFDPCFKTPNRHTWAKLQCSIIKSDTFKDCHNKVEWTPYFENCVKDSCSCDTGGDCECFCTAVAAYAQACNEAGVCVAWRTPEICPVFCDYYNHQHECTWHYSPCHTPCYKTCLNPSDNCTNLLPNVEGCYPKCPEEKPIFDEKNQICVEKCNGCIINGTEYKPGEYIPTQIPCYLCYCGKDGSENCFLQPVTATTSAVLTNTPPATATPMVKTTTPGSSTATEGSTTQFTLQTSSSETTPKATTTPVGTTTTTPRSSTAGKGSTTPLTLQTSTIEITSKATSTPVGTTTITPESSSTGKGSTTPLTLQTSTSGTTPKATATPVGTTTATPGSSTIGIGSTSSLTLQTSTSGTTSKATSTQVGTTTMTTESSSTGKGSTTPLTLQTSTSGTTLKATTTPMVTKTPISATSTTGKGSTTPQTQQTTASGTPPKATTTPVVTTTTTPESSTTGKGGTTPLTLQTFASEKTPNATTTPVNTTTIIAGSSSTGKGSTTPLTLQTSTIGTTSEATTTQVVKKTPITGSSTTGKSSTTPQTQQTSASGTTSQIMSITPNTPAATTPGSIVTTALTSQSITTGEGSTTPTSVQTSTSGTIPKPTTMVVVTLVGTPVSSAQETITTTSGSSTESKGSTIPFTLRTSTSETTLKATTTPIVTKTSISGSSTTGKGTTTPQTQQTSASGTTPKGTTKSVGTGTITPGSSTPGKGTTTPLTLQSSTSETTPKATATPVGTTTATPGSSTIGIGSTTSLTLQTSTSGTTSKETSTLVGTTTVTPKSSSTGKGSTTPLTLQTSTSGTTLKATTTPMVTKTPISGTSTTGKGSTTPQTQQTTASGTPPKATTTPVVTTTTTPGSSKTGKGGTTPLTLQTSISETTFKATATTVVTKTSTPGSSSTGKGSTTPFTLQTSTSGTTSKATITPVVTMTPISGSITTAKGSTTPQTQQTSTSETTPKGTTTPVGTGTITPGSSTTGKGTTIPFTLQSSTSETTPKATATPVGTTTATPGSSTIGIGSTTSLTLQTSTSGTTSKATSTPVGTTTMTTELSSTGKGSTTPLTLQTSTSGTTLKATTTPMVTKTPISGTSTTGKGSTTPPTQQTPASGKPPKATSTPAVTTTTTPGSSTIGRGSTTPLTLQSSTSETTFKATSTPVRTTTIIPGSSSTGKGSTTPLTLQTSTSGTTSKATATPVVTKTPTPGSSTTGKGNTTPQTQQTSASEKTPKATTSPVNITTTTPGSSRIGRGSTTPLTLQTSTSGTTSKATATPVVTTTTNPGSSTAGKGSTTPLTLQTSTSGTTAKATATPVLTTTTTAGLSTTSKGSTTLLNLQTSTSGSNSKATITPVVTKTPISGSSTTGKGSTTPTTQQTSASGTTPKATSTPVGTTTITPESSSTGKGSTTPLTLQTSTSGTTSKATATPVVTKTPTPGSSTTGKGNTTPQTQQTSASEKTPKATTSPVNITTTTPGSTTATPVVTTTTNSGSSTAGKGSTTPLTLQTSTSGTTAKATATPVLTTTTTAGLSTTMVTKTPISGSSTTGKGSTTPKTQQTSASGTTPKATSTPVGTTTITPESSSTGKGSTTPLTLQTSTSGTTSKATATPVVTKTPTPGSSTTGKGNTTPQTQQTSASEKTPKATTSPVNITTTTPGSSRIGRGSTTPLTLQTSTSGTTSKATATPVVTTTTNPGSSTTGKGSTTPLTLQTSTSGTTAKATATPVLTTTTTAGLSTTMVTKTPISGTSTTGKGSTTPQTQQTTASGTTPKATITPVVTTTTTPGSSLTGKSSTTPLTLQTSTSGTTSKATATPVVTKTSISRTSTTATSISAPLKNCTKWGVSENETFVICNCTLARCIEDYTVEIIPYECPPLQNITCSNGKPPVQVPDKYHCCKELACDCFCEGWGDPHYKTFDGLFYSYQGECTYVLMEEISPKHNLKIYIENVKCDLRESVSCPRAIIVSYNNQVITLKNHNLIGAAKLEALMDHSALNIPFYQGGVRVVSSQLNLILEIPQLRVVVMFGVTGFSVNLPFQHFGNNTQGHCGTCNNNQADDCMLPGGGIVKDCAVMANYWKAKGNTKCKPPPPPELAKPPCVINPVCELLKSELFKECHPHLTPDNYITGCQFDSCHMSNPAVVCSSLQTYAVACSRLGICINWRDHTDLCPVECPEDKVYQACGPADPPTCKDKHQDHFLNSTTEGCFCPDGMQLFNKESKQCVEKCGCLDPSGKGRELGEQFQYGCQDCVCDKTSATITCKPKQCSNNNQVTCNNPGFIVVNVTDPSDACCSILTCRCESSTCPRINDQCPFGYAPVLKLPEGKCCPELTCDPKKVCVHNGLEYKPGTSIPVFNCQECNCTWIVDPKTQLYKVKCGLITCSDKCEPGYVYVKSNSTECCGKCVIKHKNKCVIKHNGTVHTLESGTEWTPSHDACNKFICTTIDGQYVTTNHKIHCPPFNIDYCQPGTVQLSANRCCQVCVEKEKGCKVQSTFDYITHNNCRSKTKIEQTHCQGHCNSYTKYTELGSSSCSCCQASLTSIHTVNLYCPNGHSISHTYFLVEECSCNQANCLKDQNAHTNIGDTRRRRSIKLP
ncbi:mucin-2-like [Clarias gariepinus]|uniref:mucin-2-like n=1 Tax=Clarias gariepinus TaxID=13013 RepID=UPI00234D89D1|nr:mucin-2-like [Clarias gariepinus]